MGVPEAAYFLVRVGSTQQTHSKTPKRKAMSSVSISQTQPNPSATLETLLSADELQSFVVHRAVLGKGPKVIGLT
jgi:hypothetical protein